MDTCFIEESGYNYYLGQRVLGDGAYFLFLPLLLSSLVPIADELAHPCGRAEALVLELVSYTEAPLHT